MTDGLNNEHLNIKQVKVCYSDFSAIQLLAIQIPIEFAFLNFQNTPFVSYLRAIIASDDITMLENAQQGDMTMPCRRLEVSLIDTSANEDVNIASQMVQLFGSKIRD